MRFHGPREPGSCYVLFGFLGHNPGQYGFRIVAEENSPSYADMTFSCGERTLDNVPQGGPRGPGGPKNHKCLGDPAAAGLGTPEMRIHALF